MSRRPRIKRPPIEIFNLSFLDIIACAFGAIVLLVLLAKNNEVPAEMSAEDVMVRIERLMAVKQRVNELQERLLAEEEALQMAEAEAASILEGEDALEASLPRAQQSIARLQGQAQSLREQIRREQARIQVPSAPEEPSSMVGGIPTDAEYVIFVIDTSGSMSVGGGWQQVTNVLTDIIRNHPELKGFQIIDADGKYMFSNQQGRWLTDSPSMRRRAIQGLQNFRGGGSAPEVGMMQALRQYRNHQGKTSMYVFGDDFRPGTLDEVVMEITRLNQGLDGEPRWRIHGVGFHRERWGDAPQFAAFMKAVTERNRGSFVALPN
ncbi:VWA domain-containing protein [Aliidiomarina halalkaliphila]|uniref:VWA domain-containing protein n=1 Tax=Aliidiomarina halalkaliphila TaxID=2593535 RepID=A0A552X0W6_9GAMM|nr:vWA domain-containing protein [Aliidiomarina halalkaliphila]TRW48690.1 VWA domain-containing protein [Aliidiomarina halalkaliphila]